MVLTSQELCESRYSVEIVDMQYDILFIYVHMYTVYIYIERDISMSIYIYSMITPAYTQGKSMFEIYIYINKDICTQQDIYV